MKRDRKLTELKNGIGSYALKNGEKRYRVVYRAEGKVHTRAGFTTKRAAEVWHNQNRVSLDTGNHVAPQGGRTLFGDWYCQWQATTAELRPSTRARDESYARNHLLPTFASLPLRNINHLAVRTWVVELRAKGLAPATVQKAYQILSKVMKAAVLGGLIAQNPCHDVPLPRIEDDEARFLEPEELVYLEDAMDSYWRDVVPFLADTGLRIGEAAALRWRDLDFQRLTVTVKETLVEVPARLTADGTGTVIGPPKTKAGRRTVPTLTRETADRLAARMGSAPADGFVFAGREGGPLRPQGFRKRAWGPAVRRAGLVAPLPTPHSLRHTAIAIWIATGTTDAFKLQKWAGHRSITTIYRVYGHLLPTDATEQLEGMSAMRAAARAAVADRKVISLVQT